MDVHTKEQRSFNMFRVRSKNTKPELVLFKALQKKGIKFKRHYNNIAGKPDIAFPKEKVAIFVDGEFWHGKGFKNWKDQIPPFWYKKIGENILRDRKNRLTLKKSGWTVIKFWGRDLIKKPDHTLKVIRETIKQR